MNTVENNILIAKFMGYEIVEYQHGKYQPIYNGNKYAKTIGEQKQLWGGLDLQFTGRFTENVNYPFGSDWNYLMPIIKKIEQLQSIKELGDIYEIEEFLLIRDELCTGRIENSYSAVIDFINWYNEQK